MQDDILFSIVVPIYGVEKYLERSLTCLLNQTYNNFEVIMVNDCSPDRCDSICENYKKIDSRFRYLKLEKNGGLSNARNQGFKYVNGDYVLFLDSDDYYDSDLLEKVHSRIQENNSDLLVYGLIEEYSENDTIKYTKNISMEDSTLTKKECMDKIIIELESQSIFGYAWNKCYKTNIIRDNSLMYENISMIEDVLFNLSYIKYVKVLDILPFTPYHYAIRQSGSLTSKYLSDYFDTHSKRVLCFMDYYSISSYKEEAYNKLANIYNRYLLSALTRNCSKLSNMKYSDRKKWLKKVYKSDLHRRLKVYMKPNGLVLKILYMPFKKESILLSLMEARFIYMVKTIFPMLFAKVKQNR